MTVDSTGSNISILKAIDIANNHLETGWSELRDEIKRSDDPIEKSLLTKEQDKISDAALALARFASKLRRFGSAVNSLENAKNELADILYEDNFDNKSSII
jgi:hypothetical protein